MQKILEEEEDLWCNTNAVWNPQNVDPPHVNCMKKAEAVPVDGKCAVDTPAGQCIFFFICPRFNRFTM